MVKSKESRNKNSGFTLIELIIVIAIIAVLALVAVPKFGQIQKEANEKADLATAKNLHSIATALVANDKVTVPSSDIISKLVAGQIDGSDGSGNLPFSKSEASHRFIVVVDGNRNVQVGIQGTGKIVYPHR